jgi:hypothetical protein
VRALVVVGALLAALASGAEASSSSRPVLLGIHGDPARFAAQTGQKSEIQHVFISFAQGAGLQKVVSQMGPVPLLALIAGAYGSGESATPRGLALGGNDAFLITLNGVVDAWAGDRFYVRPFPEMNAYWEATCAYNKDGSLRDAAHATAWTRKALARIAIVLRGGARAAMNAKLRRLGMPGVAQALPVTTSKLRLVWNPQGFGAPDLPANAANAYYPGDPYVDVVGDDLYDIAGHGATWDAAARLYESHPSKPFSFPEWGVWGFDDPQFIRDMASWVGSHRRVEFLAYFEGNPGAVWDLATKPRSRAAYRALITPLG